MKQTLALQSVGRRQWRELSPSALRQQGQLSVSPGVYAFYGKNNNLLYIGKSKSLKQRVSSYFQSRSVLIPKIKIFAPKIAKIRITETKTEFEALLVEAGCIREFKPKYNSRLTDDRSPLYIVITEEEFPRVVTARKTDLGGIAARSVYGPFLSGETVRRILKMARRLFPYCNRLRRHLERGAQQRVERSSEAISVSVAVGDLDSSTPLRFARNDQKPCFYRHLGLCPGVCSGEISRRQYLGIIKKLEQFLSGDFAGLKVRLEKEMKAAAKKQEFETAAKLRDQAGALNSLLLAGENEEQMTVTGIDRVKALVGLLTKVGLLQNTQKTRRTGNSDISGKPEKSQFRHSDFLTVRPSGFLPRRQAGPSIPSFPISSFRIEGFDVSNLSGRMATAAMVVFIGGVKEPREYRHFRIIGSFVAGAPQDDGGGDPRMVAEAVGRRLGHPEWGKADLIVIDGGEPQLREVWFLSKKVSYLGLAKNPDRLVIPVKDKFKTVIVSAGDPGFQLLQQVRDEAHRFSRRLHLKLRRKALME